VAILSFCLFLLLLLVAIALLPSSLFFRRARVFERERERGVNMLPEYRLKHTKRKSREEKRERNKRAALKRALKSESELRPRLYRKVERVRVRRRCAFVSRRATSSASARPRRPNWIRATTIGNQKKTLFVFFQSNRIRIFRERERERRTKKRRNSSPTATREPERK